MSEWWTYNPFEMLMFSPQAYWRLVERYQQGWWPGPVLMPLLGLGCWLLLTRASEVARRVGWVLLALAWGWVGWGFHWQRYAEIFLGAPWLAASAWLQATMLLLLAAWPRPAAHLPSPVMIVGGSLLMTGALAYPLAALAQRVPLPQAEFFGSMPDPTALGTLGLVLSAPGLSLRLRGLAAVVPALSLVWGWGTRWAMAG